MGVDIVMHVVPKEPILEAKMNELAIRLYDAFGSFVWVNADPKINMRCLKITDDYYAEEFEADQVLEVSTISRYYGPGYERGNIIGAIGVAEWLEFNMPGCQVFYSGDCDFQKSAFGPNERAEYLKHFHQHGHIPYQTGFLDGRDEWAKQDCDFCNIPMIRNGAGHNYAGLFCHGCPTTKTTRDGGKTWTVEYR